MACNRPVLIRGGARDWPALQLWRDNSYFRSELADKHVTVAVTPNGLADIVVGDRQDKIFFIIISMQKAYMLLSTISNKNLQHKRKMYFIQFS